MSYPFSMVLHTHLPMVVNHGRWPHGSDWLNEAAFECYLPLLETAHRLVADGISPKWTINLPPVLTEQLASPEFQKELSFYYENVRRACVESREFFGKLNEQSIVALTYFWEEFYERMWELHRRIGGDIPGTFAELQRGGHLEIITCAATHGYLPLLSRDEALHLQLPTGVEAHKLHFGRAPRAIWLPECAYRRRYQEFHREHFTGGLRFWRISDSSGALGRKQVYDPKSAAEKVGRQASHFVGIVKETIDANRDSIGALVCSPYDSELFGHWWFEGPLWLEHVAREMYRGGVQPMTLTEAKQAGTPHGPLTLPEGSWGEGRDHRLWLHRDTEATVGLGY